MFTADTLAFFADLSLNNDREWFEANKPRYERVAKGPALDFIRDFVAPLAKIAPQYLAIPKAQGGSLFRIHRDTRFATDKTPYKTHLGVHFRHQLALGDVHAPGFYLHIEPGSSMFAAGMWMPPSPALKNIRKAVADEEMGWGAVRKGLDAAGFAMEAESLKRVPAGFPPDHPYAEDLRRKHFAAMRRVDDDEVLRGDLIERFAQFCAQAVPLTRFLCRSQGLPF